MSKCFDCAKMLLCDIFLANGVPSPPPHYNPSWNVEMPLMYPLRFLVWITSGCTLALRNLRLPSPIFDPDTDSTPIGHRKRKKMDPTIIFQQ